MPETLRWRGEDADVGRVDAFTQAIDRECARVLAKSGIAAEEERRRFVRSRQPLSTARRSMAGYWPIPREPDRLRSQLMTTPRRVTGTLASGRRSNLTATASPSRNEGDP
jgi:hypothetical protein